ncbi:MAG: hypothetical protein V7K76_18495 [Nostoc sp.]|uniref:hypothetical protein n=1 Tax=Nostoc sp. TaxID=1180 RepID=UPI002FFBE3EA
MFSTVEIIGCINTVVSLLYCYYCLLRIRKSKKIQLSPVSSIFIVISNGLAIPFIQYANPEYKLPYGDDLTITSFISMMIFIIISFGFQIISDKFNKTKKNNQFQKYEKRKSIFYFYFVFILVIFGFFRFVFLSGGISFLGVILANLNSSSAYYSSRLETGSLIGSTTGMGLAFMANSFLIPSLLAAIVYLKKTTSLKESLADWGFIIVLMTLNIVLSAIFAKRLTLLISFFLPLAILYINKNKKNYENITNKNSKMSLFKSFNKNFSTLFFVVLLLGLAIGIFSITSGDSFALSFLSLLDRIFIIPCGTSNYYYEIFPARIPFQGIQNILDLPSDISYSDIAKLSTGDSFTANACFLAIAYSGAGFFGIAAISIIYSVLVTFHDWWLNRVDKLLGMIVLAVNIYGVSALANVPLLPAIVSYGFLSSTLVISLMIKRSTFLKIF